MTKKIRILLPVLNEENNIVNFHKELNEDLKLIAEYSFDVLFIVDKSSDKSAEIIEKICNDNANCEALIMSSRYGHQECLFAGFEYSLTYDAVITMDCDFQHPTELIKNIVEKFSAGFEIVNTSRIENKKRSIFKRFGTELFYYFIKKFALPSLENNSSDFRLLSKKIINIIVEKFHERKVLIRGIVSTLGFKNFTIKYKEKDRKFGETKYNFIRLFDFAINGIISFTSRPLYLIFYIGIILTILSILLLFYFFVSFIISNEIPAGYTSIVVMQNIFGSIIIFFLGVLGIYVGKIYEEIKFRPRYIVEKEILKSHE